MKPFSTKILRDISTAIGLYIQSQFILSQMNPSLLSSIINSVANSNQSTGQSGNPSSNSNPAPNVQQTQQPSFMFRGIWIPLIFSLKSGQTKSHYLEQLDKLEVPNVPDGYGLSTAYHCMIEMVRSIVLLVEGSTDRLDSNQANITTTGHQTPSAPGSAVRSSRTSSESSDITSEIHHKSMSAKNRDRIDQHNSLDPDVRSLHESLLNSSWCGLLASLSLLLESSTDEQITELILKYMEVMISLYGVYKISTARDAFTIALCRSSLPLGYHLPSLIYKLPVSGSECSTPTAAAESSGGDNMFSLQSIANSGSAAHSRSSSIDLSASSGVSFSGNSSLLSSNSMLLQQQMQTSTVNPTSYLSGSAPSESSELRQQVVAVGTALPSVNPNCNSNSASGTSGPVMLTAKNLQCMRSVLTVAHFHGTVLDDSWHHILTTLQHLVWILGLKPSTGGSLKAGLSESGSSATSQSLITTAAMSDLPVLSAMLSRLFSSSQ